ncbi:MAG: R3H domain-containing nucleic acid-binding protein [Chthoniobacteraceae bacterium]
MKPNPKEYLDTMLGHLDFSFEIKEFPNDNGLTLQVYSPERERLLGRRGELLDDIQCLLNRMLQAQDRDSPRVVVDIEHWREMQDDALVQRIRQIADVVRTSGRSYQLEPMNSYERRVIHNAFKNDPDVMTWSPQDDARIKRITLKRRTPQK